MSLLRQEWRLWGSELGQSGSFMQEVALEEVKAGRRSNSESTRFCSKCLPAEVGILRLKSNQRPAGKEKDYYTWSTIFPGTLDWEREDTEQTSPPGQSLKPASPSSHKQPGHILLFASCCVLGSPFSWKTSFPQAAGCWLLGECRRGKRWKLKA